MWRLHCPVIVESCTIAVLLLGTLRCVGQTTDQQPRSGSRQTALKEVLSWLPGDTETVIGANGPFPLPDFEKPDGNDSEREELSSADLELRMRVLPVGLFAFKSGGLQKALNGKAVALAVEGSRHFRPPTALGEMLYEGCVIAVFGNAITLDRDSFMKNAVNSAVRFEDMAGVRIAVFEEGSENDVWTTFVGFPRNNIVLVATNVDYLREVLARMGGASGRRALPETLPEWKYVNTSAPVWGLRHYRKREADLDPTSPFSEQAAANVPDKTAIGLTFWFEPAVGRMATVAYLSANRNARQVLESYLSVADANSASPREFRIRFRQPAPGVIEGSVALSAAEALDRLLFGLFAMLGHAVYV